MVAPPAVSVVIATYNWSAALRCALRSVLKQTFTDFEVLVVGDHCTDDSAEVVASFGDGRLHWHNLETNHGGQWGPNNFGLRAARGEWIAYLGHDDIWYPTHLERGLGTARETGADLVAAATILYGPPGTGVRGVTGLFADDVYSPNEFVPPSSLLHRRSLAERVGYWKDPATTTLPIDWVFLRQAVAAGARLVPTNELTVFKLNAAWRRDAYRRKSVDEQEALLSRIEGGGDFRPAEMIDVLRAAACDRFWRVPAPAEGQLTAGMLARLNRQFKGVEARFAPGELRRLTSPERFSLTDQPPSFEWHGEEMDPLYGSYRWTGPSARSTIELPVLMDQTLEVHVGVLHVIDPVVLETLTLGSNGRTLPFRIERRDDGPLLLRTTVAPREAGTADPFRLDLSIDKTRRPCDLGINDDRRWVGVAVGWVEIAPADG